MSTRNPADTHTLAHPRCDPVTRTAKPPGRRADTRGSPDGAVAEISRHPRLASMPMGNTRPLPQQSAPGQPGPRPPRPRRGRGRRDLKRAAIGLAAVIAVLALAAGVLWVATPSAREATQLAASLAMRPPRRCRT